MSAMPESQYPASLYILAATGIGLVVGALVGGLLDTAIEPRRLIAVIAAFLAVIADVLFRRYMARSLPRFFLGGRRSRTPLSLLLVAIITALACGLAVHDIGQMLNLLSGWALGAGAGLLAGLITATLVTLLDSERRDAGRDTRP